jgi:hypothetical protein
MCRFVDLGSIQYKGVVSGIGEVLSNFFLTFEFNYIIICIKLWGYVE